MPQNRLRKRVSVSRRNDGSIHSRGYAVLGTRAICCNDREASCHCLEQHTSQSLIHRWKRKQVRVPKYLEQAVARQVTLKPHACPPILLDEWSHFRSYLSDQNQ